MSADATLPGRDTRLSTPWRALGPIYVVAGIVAFATAWTLYVFQGSQLAFVIATAISAAAAARLAWIRSRLTTILVLGEIALVGTDVSGQLAAGTAVMGSLRMLDVTVAAALGGLGLRGLLGRTPHSRIRVTSALRAPLTAVLLATLALATGLWAVNGAPVDSLVRADLRLVGLGVAMWIITRHCKEGPPRSVAFAVALVAPLVTVKALAIWVSGLHVIGYDDRIQAAGYGEGISARVVLVGGDTLLVLAPVAALMAYRTVSERWTRRWALTCFGLALVGLLVSGTRSSVLVALVVVGLFVAYEWRRGERSIGGRATAAAMCALVGLVAGALATGLAERFVTADAPHIGLNFREEEARDFLQQPAEAIWVGEGFGGRYETRDAYGRTVVTGWSHALPLWLLLKAGVIGVAAWLFALAVVARRFGPLSRRSEPTRQNALLGLAVLAALMLLSLTLGRATLPEGAALIGFAFALLPPPRSVA